MLSCGDFLCPNCAKLTSVITVCPLCNKSDPLSVNLAHSDLPKEITNNLEDCSDILESLYTVFEFQIKSYKRILKKLLMERAMMQR